MCDCKHKINISTLISITLYYFQSKERFAKTDVDYKFIIRWDIKVQQQDSKFGQNPIKANDWAGEAKSWEPKKWWFSRLS